MVIKQRKKRASNNPKNKFIGIQPVPLLDSKIAPMQQVKKNIDPLVKMQMEKKKKKLE